MDVKMYSCPNCGAELKFDPDRQLFGCEYCRGSFTRDQLNKMFEQVEDRKQEQIEQQTQQPQQPSAPKTPAEELEERRRAEFEENTRLYECPTCGAEIVADSNTAASFCYYCHNPVILKGRVGGMYRPSRVLPFSFGRDKAVEIFNKWASDKKFVPDDLVSAKQIEKMTGLYVPFWVADAMTRSRMTAIGETVRSWSSGNYRYTQTKEFEVVRDITVEYDGVPADGSRKIEDSLMEAIEPYDYTQTKDFDMAYLSGFFADKFDVDRDEIYGRIQSRMFSNNETALQSSCGYDRLKSKNIQNAVTKLRWNYMLLPVWFMTFNYNGKVWSYAINGQTGKVAGELPIDEKKLRKHRMFIMAMTAAITLAAGYIIGGFIL